MQDCQVQLFRPPIPIRRPCARGVMEWAFCFGLSWFFVCHICLSVVGDVSETPPLTRSPLRKIFAVVLPEAMYHHGIWLAQYIFPIRSIGISYGRAARLMLAE
jgi:hypothetical protein